MSVPSLTSIEIILKKHFHLRYKASKPAMVKYIDPTYNERRLWVSRLLAQFFKEEAVIISIDESNFRVDAFRRRKWVFAPTQRSVSKILNSNVIEIESKLPPLSYIEPNHTYMTTTDQHHNN